MWIDDAINSYYTFLKENTSVFKDTDSEWVVISTPFLGMFNDSIDIYCKETNGTITMSDDGKTLSDLDLVGAGITRSPKRKEIVEKILLNYGVKTDGEELIVTATMKDFAQKKHNLVSAILEIADMYMLAKQTVMSVFREDVKGFLDEQQIIYTPQFISKGSTGLEFTFDFQIATRNKEIVINTFNNVNKTNLARFLFNWEDIKETRERLTSKELIGLAVINDQGHEIRPEYLEAFSKKKADYFLWTERYKPENLLKLKAAS